jgi:hypothetical protein
MNFHAIFSLQLTLALCAALGAERGHAASQDTLGAFMRPAGQNASPSLWNTNIVWWRGVWREDTNHLRVEMCCDATNTPRPEIFLMLGSTEVNCEGLYQRAPDGKFAKCELRSALGRIIPPRPGASIESEHPLKISFADIPKTKGRRRVEDTLIFSTNGLVATVAAFAIPDVYHIPEEGDYTLTLTAVVYRFRTGSLDLDRIDLPSLSAVFHLYPSPSEASAAPERRSKTFLAYFLGFILCLAGICWLIFRPRTHRLLSAASTNAPPAAPGPVRSTF